MEYLCSHEKEHSRFVYALTGENIYNIQLSGRGGEELCII